jgi:hypothetical protein
MPFTHLDEQSLLIITESSNGLGDFFAGLKMIKRLKTVSPRLKIQWLVTATKTRDDLLRLIKEAEQELGEGVVLFLRSIDFVDINPYQSIELILFYPTVHVIYPKNFHKLKSLGAPFVQLQEYDAEPLRYNLPNKYEVTSINTGFDGLGLFLDAPETAQSVIPLADILPESMRLNPNHQLFFSYLNLEVEEVFNEADFSRYAEIALSIETSGKNIDLVTNSSIKALSPDFFNFAFELGFKSVVFINLNKDKSISETSYSSPQKNGPDRVLRIINPFPLSALQMRSLMAHAHPVAQVTGDQSLSELLSFSAAGKGVLPFYQIMNWKSSLHEHWMRLCEQYLGKESHYLHLISLLKPGNTIDPKEFATYWLEHQALIIQESLVLGTKLYRNHNLYNHGPQFLDILFGLKKHLPKSLYQSAFPLAAQLINLCNEESIVRMLEHIASTAHNNEEEAKATMDALTQWLTLNPVVQSEQELHYLIDQLVQVTPRDRAHLASNAQNFLRRLPSSVQRMQIPLIFTEFAKISSPEQRQLFIRLEGTKELKIAERVNQPQWLSNLIEQSSSYRESELLKDKNHILLAVHVVSDGWGDLIKYIGIYRMLQQAFPQTRISSIIQCAEDRKSTLLTMLRDSEIPLSETRISTYKELRIGNMNRALFNYDEYAINFYENYSLIISIATPFPEINKEIRKDDHLRVPYIELAEVNAVSHLRTGDFGKTDAAHNFVLMGLTKDSAGLEITPAQLLSTKELLEQLSPSLKNALLDGSHDSNAFLQDSFFMPAYLKYDSGALSLYFALALMNTYYQEKHTAILWLYELPDYLTNLHFLAHLKESGFGSLVVYDAKGIRSETLIPEAQGQKTLRLVIGSLSTKDFDLLYQLSASTGGFAGAVGQNSVEKTISFNLVPAFYAPRWQVGIIYQLQNIVLELFAVQSKEYACLMDYLELLDAIQNLTLFLNTLASCESAQPFLTELDPHDPRTYMQTVKRLLQEFPKEIQGLLPSDLGIHPIEQVQQFFTTHDVGILLSGWQTVTKHIQEHHNLNQWIVKQVENLLPNPHKKGQRPGETREVTIKKHLLSGARHKALTLDDHPQTHQFLSAIMKEACPYLAQSKLEFILTDSHEYLLKPLQGGASLQLLIRIDALHILSQEELIFALKMMENIYRFYPVENILCQIEQIPPKVLLEGIKEHLEYGIDYCRKMLTLNQGSEEITQNQELIKYISLLLAEQNKKGLVAEIELIHTPIPENVTLELSNSSKVWPNDEMDIEYESSLEQLKYLRQKLPRLAIRSDFEYERLTFEGAEFLKEVQAVECTPLTPEIEAELAHLIEDAYLHRFAGFTKLYPLIMQKLHPQGGWSPQGPFSIIVEHINAFLSARHFEPAQQIAHLLEQLLANEYQNLFINQYWTKSIHKSISSFEKEEKPLYSSIGANMAWHAYFTLPVLGSTHYEQLATWAQQDQSGMIAQLLFRLGMMDERRFWPQLPAKAVKSFSDPYAPSTIIFGTIPSSLKEMNYAGRARPKLTEEFITIYLQYCYATEIILPPEGQRIDKDFIEDFIKNHLDELSLSEVIPQTAHALLTLFEGFLAAQPNAAQAFIHQFYLDSSYPYGVQQLIKRRAQFPMIHTQIWIKNVGSSDMFNPENTRNNPFVHFLIKHQPQYLPLEHLFLTLKQNFIMSVNRWPLEYFLNFFNITLDSLEKVLRAVKELQNIAARINDREAINYIQAGIVQVYDAATKTLPNLRLFAKETYLFLNQIHDTQWGSFREAAKNLWQNPRVRDQLKTASYIELSAFELADMYSLLDRNVTWENDEDRNQFCRILIQALEKAEEAEQLKAIEVLLFGKVPLSDMSLTKELIKRWGRLKAKELGVDDNTYNYYLKAAKICQNAIKSCPGLYSNELMETLLRTIQAQSRLTGFVDKTLNPNIKEEFGVDKTSVLIGITKKLAEKNLSLDAVEFLTYELNKETLERFLNALDKDPANYNIFKINESIYDHIDRNKASILAILFYHNFWNRTLEERAVLINHLLIPSSKMGKAKDEAQAYIEAYRFVTSVLFPKEDKESDMAKALLHSFLSVGHPHVRSYLLTSVISANKAVKGGENNVTAVLPKLAEAMGAAGVKAGQAAHSYPKTPTDMRASLASLKSQTRLPYRWELMKLIHKILPQELLASIKRVNSLLGGASFYLAVEVEMNDGSIRVLRLMRDNAAKEAQYGFDHLKAMLAHCKHPSIQGIQSDLQHIIGEAEAGAAVEIDTASVAQQYALAKKIYAQSEEIINTGGQQFIVWTQPVQLFAHGPGFQLISKAEGIEFNELKKDPSKAALCKAIALAVCKTELTHLLGNSFCDIDRHGAQSRIEYEEIAPNQFNVVITHYDFGELSPVPPTSAQLYHCHQFIKEAVQETLNPWKLMIAYMKGGESPINELASKLMEYIRRNKKEGEQSQDTKRDDLSRLRGLFKGLLALNDYFEVLAQDASLLMQLVPIIKSAVDLEKNVTKSTWLTLSDERPKAVEGEPLIAKNTPWFSLFSKKPKVEGEPATKRQNTDEDVKMMDILEP